MSHKCSSRSCVVFVCAALFALVGCQGQKRVSDVTLPPGAFSADTMFVMCADPTVDPQRFEQTMHVLRDALPSDQAAALDAFDESRLAIEREYMTMWTRLRDAGVQLVVVLVPSSTKAGEAGTDARRIFVKLDADGDRGAAVTALASIDDFWLGVVKTPAAREMQLAPHDGRWFYLTGPGLAAPPSAPQEAIAQRFKAELEKLDAGVVRTSWRMPKAMRVRLREALTRENPDLVERVLSPLAESFTELDTVATGLTLGEQPQLRIDMTFSSALAAMDFKGKVQSLIAYHNLGVLLGMEDNEALSALQRAQMMHLLQSLANADRTNATLSYRIDRAFFEEAGTIGMAWNRIALLELYKFPRSLGD